MSFELGSERVQLTCWVDVRRGRCNSGRKELQRWRRLRDKKMVSWTEASSNERIVIPDYPHSPLFELEVIGRDRAL